MREKDYYGAIKGFCLKWNLPEVWNSDRITGANLIYEVIKVINAMIIELRDYEDRVDGKLEDMLKMIEDFLKMFNEDLSETVLNILLQWKESGELEEIINDALFNQKLDKSVFESFKETYDQTILSIENKINELKEKTESDLSDLDLKLDDQIENQQDIFIDLINERIVSKDIQNGYEDGEIFIAIVPLINEDGSINMPIPELFANGETVEKNLSEEKVLVFNAGYGKGSHGYGVEGRNIINGVIMQDEPARTENYKTLVWNMEGDMTMIDNEIDCQTILNMGYTQAVSGYRHVVQDGTVQWWDVVEKAQRTAMGKLYNGDVIVAFSTGRTSSDIGFSIPSFADEVRKLLKGKLKDLFMLDGGGSTQGNLYGTNLIIQGDSNFTEFRPVFSQAYFKRPHKTTPNNLTNTRNSVGKKIQDLTFEQSKYKFTRTVSDFNDCKDNGFYYGSPSTLNKPKQGSGYIIVLKNNGGNVTQIYVANTSERWEEQAGMMMRTYVLSGDYWTAWVDPNYNACNSVSDLNNVYRTGKYYCPDSTLNTPNIGRGYVDVYSNTDGSIMQLYYPNSTGASTTQHYAKRTGSFTLVGKVTTWNNWKIYE